jgi:hypothetical protein
MKINELKKSFEENKDYVPKIHVKGNAPIFEKIAFVDNLKADVIEVDERGMSKIKHFRKVMLVDTFLIKHYTTIEFDDEVDVLEQYDFLMSKGIMTKIHQGIKSKCEVEYMAFMDIIDKELEQEIHSTNSLEGVIASGIQSLIEKIPEEETLLELVKSIDPSKLKTLKKLFDFAKG